MLDDHDQLRNLENLTLGDNASSDERNELFDLLDAWVKSLTWLAIYEANQNRVESARQRMTTARAIEELALSEGSLLAIVVANGMRSRQHQATLQIMAMTPGLAERQAWRRTMDRPEFDFHRAADHMLRTFPAVWEARETVPKGMEMYQGLDIDKPDLRPMKVPSVCDRVRVTSLEGLAILSEYVEDGRLTATERANFNARIEALSAREKFLEPLVLRYQMAYFITDSDDLRNGRLSWLAAGDAFVELAGGPKIPAQRGLVIKRLPGTISVQGPGQKLVHIISTRKYSAGHAPP